MLAGGRGVVSVTANVAPEKMAAMCEAAVAGDSKAAARLDEALASLQKNGFFPARAGREGDVEILSANGELSVTLKDGVKYVMRFGNIAGVADAQDNADDGDGQEAGDASSQGGVNRYLLVTTMVDESRFPPPELQAVPKTIEELKVLLNPPKQEPASDPSGGDESATESADAPDTAD